MSAQAPAKAPYPKNDVQSSKLDEPQTDVRRLTSLSVWRQVIIGELLNLLEKRRYDAVSN